MLALTVTLTASGCLLEEETKPEDDPKLIALKQDEMATYRPPGGRMVLNLGLPEGGSIGEPSLARIVRLFSYRNPEQAERARAATVQAAQATGWKLNLEGNDESPVFGRKRIATGGITLIIGWYKEKANGRYQVSISLEHQPCGRGRCF